MWESNNRHLSRIEIGKVNILTIPSTYILCCIVYPVFIFYEFENSLPNFFELWMVTLSINTLTDDTI